MQFLLFFDSGTVTSGITLVSREHHVSGRGVGTSFVSSGQRLLSESTSPKHFVLHTGQERQEKIKYQGTKNQERKSLLMVYL